MQRSLHIERSIHALFLARSCSEEYRAFKKVPPSCAEEGIYALNYTCTPYQDKEGFQLFSLVVSWQEDAQKQSISLSRVIPDE